jgi:hypothetical protein
MHHHTTVHTLGCDQPHKFFPQRQLLPTARVHRHCKQHRRIAVQTAAAAAYTNPIGVHALVFAGDWSEASVVAAASGAAKVIQLFPVRLNCHKLCSLAEAVQGIC